MSITLDTGDINSHDDMGINSSPEDRLTYRRITTCFVLNDTSYITGMEWQHCERLEREASTTNRAGQLWPVALQEGRITPTLTPTLRPFSTNSAAK